MGQAEPAIHATAIKARGELHGVIDPAARGRSQKDGETLKDAYEANGLDLALANNGVESGILEVWQRLSTGRLKVFKSLGNFLAEYRIYRRDENGKIIVYSSKRQIAKELGICKNISDRIMAKHGLFYPTL